MKGINEIVIHRFENPFMMFDWIFNLFSQAKIFKKAIRGVNDQAEKVQLNQLFLPYVTALKKKLITCFYLKRETMNFKKKKVFH